MERSRSLLDEVLECEDEGAICAILCVVSTHVSERAGHVFYKSDGDNNKKWEHPMIACENFDAFWLMTARMTNKCTCDKEK